MESLVGCLEVVLLRCEDRDTARARALHLLDVSALHRDAAQLHATGVCICVCLRVSSCVCSSVCLAALPCAR